MVSSKTPTFPRVNFERNARPFTVRERRTPRGTDKNKECEGERETGDERVSASVSVQSQSIINYNKTAESAAN